MKTNALILVIVTVVIGVGFLLFTDSEDTAQSNERTTDMTAIPADLSGTIERAIERQELANVAIIDVRTDEEWNQEHVSGALHWGLVEHLENGELPPLSKDMEIYVTCRSGNRASQAILIMQEAGYTNLTNIGGLDDWKAAGGQTSFGVDGSIQ